MSDGTRQAVLDLAQRYAAECKLAPGTPHPSTWEPLPYVLDAHVADERRRAVAAIGCIGPPRRGLYFGTWTCRSRRARKLTWRGLRRLRPDDWCAPCRAQAELEAEGS